VETDYRPHHDRPVIRSSH